MSSDTAESKREEPMQTKERTRKGGKGKKKDVKLSHLAQLNQAYHKHAFKTDLEKNFKDNIPIEQENGMNLHVDPFTCCVLPNFIKDEHFLDGLKDELLDQIFYEKNNDLYKFQQTDDLRKISTPHVRALRKLLYEEFLDWLKDVTGIPFSDKVDMTCSRYDYTDVLLCHDDELEGRRVAFILYLVPPWTSKDGGTLDLFNMDDNDQPKDIVRSLIPKWNQLVWFEVTPASHHQVSEVLTQGKTRLSISGWFHGPTVPRKAKYVEPRLPLKPYLSIEEELVYDWINPIYLDPDVQGQIQEKFENDSEIELQGFLKEDMYHAVVKALKEEDIKWKKRGPPNKRNYFKASEDSIPEIIQQCLKLFQSEAMFLTLSNLTGLSFHELAPRSDTESESDSEAETEAGEMSSVQSVQTPTEDLNSIQLTENLSKSDIVSEKATTSRRKRRKLNTEGDDANGKVEKNGKKSEEKEKKSNPRCRGEVRKWNHGCYTLIYDTDAEGSEFALDATLFCACKGWQQEYGGYTSYIAKGEDEELLTVNPAENSLALVYRDKDTLKFAKHVNHGIEEMQNGPEFYDFSFVYFE